MSKVKKKFLKVQKSKEVKNAFKKLIDQSKLNMAA